MKRILFPILSLILILFCSSCDLEEQLHPDFLVGHWVSVNDSKEAALILNFDGERLMVKNGAYCYAPFLYDRTWYYYMTSDSVLYLTLATDDDSSDEPDQLALDLYMSNNDNTLKLVYCPVSRYSKTITFIRR